MKRLVVARTHHAFTKTHTRIHTHKRIHTCTASSPNTQQQLCFLYSLPELTASMPPTAPTAAASAISAF